MDTSGKVNSQGSLTKIKNDGDFGKVRISVEKLMLYKTF